MNSDDPFIQVQQDVTGLLSTARQLFSSYLRIRSLASSRRSPELLSAHSELEGALADLEIDLEDLRLAVSEGERDPYRFGLEVEAVAKRRKWLKEVEGEISDIKEELGKEAEIMAGTAKGRQVVSSSTYDEEQGQAGDDSYTHFEQMYQQELMRNQDVQLESVSRTVGNLRMQANDMSRELEDQAAILEDTDAIAERVEGKLKKGMRNLTEFARQNEDKYSSCCIAVLIFVLILLLVLVLVL
ncbi:Syntaxin-10 [Dactylella cylindrospora]|nr:Syntaxin-10 [Dactylella cylindrospora]